MALAFSAGSAAQTYSNPVLRRDCPDPTLLDDRARSGYFYVYSTQSQRDGNATASRDASADRPEDIINLPIYRSRNLMDWEFAADGFAEGRPRCPVSTACVAMPPTGSDDDSIWPTAV